MKSQKSKIKSQNLNSEVKSFNPFFLKKYLIFLSLIFTVFVFYFSYYSIERVDTLNSYYYDLGIMDQVVYNTSRGRFLEMTNPTFLKNMSRFAIHFDPILAFFAPFYWLWPNFKVLLIGQALIVGLGGLAIFLLSNLLLQDKKISFIFALFYFLNFHIARSLLFDFHAITLVIPLLILAFYFYHRKNYRLYYLFIFLSLLTKEHVGLFLAFLGIFYFLNSDKKNGLLTFLIGLFSFLLINFFIIPYFREGGHFALSYYQPIKSDIKNFLLNLFSGEKIDYLKRILLPFIFNFFSPLSFLLVVPEFLINYLSKNANMRSYYFHYQSLIIAALFYGMILGYKKIDYFKNKGMRFFLIALFFLVNFYYFYQCYPLPFFVREKIVYHQISQEKKKSIYLWKKVLKDENIILATTPKLAPFFTQRKYYFNFLFDPAWYNLGYSDEEIFNIKKDVYKKADYIVINKDEIGDEEKDNALSKIYNNFSRDKNFTLIYNQGGIEVYKKSQNSNVKTQN